MREPTATAKPGIEAPAPGGTVPITNTIDMPARVNRDSDGALWAEIPALPGCVAGGETLDGVLTNLREAAEG